ncbi:MAG: hypothetical protein R3B96_12125 [Pirellulaceae bacterium]
MRRVAFLTMKNPEGFFVYDQLLVAPLSQRGWEVIDVPWDEEGVDWSRFDAVIIRSPWDYQQNASHFLHVLAEISASGTKLFNSLEVVRWNIRKTYLLDLERLGIPIVPTLWGSHLRADDLAGAYEQFETDTLVIKPVVGANADDTFRLRLGDTESAEEAMRVHQVRPYQLQPYIESIETEGEWSLFHFRGQYSHAILKRPASGDFRVQEEHGGRIAAAEPEPAARELADRIGAAIPFDTLYARIDLIRLSNGDFATMEVELIEPSLYFQCDERSPERFCDAFVEAMTESESTAGSFTEGPA